MSVSVVHVASRQFFLRIAAKPVVLCFNWRGRSASDCVSGGYGAGLGAFPMVEGVIIVGIQNAKTNGLPQ